MSNTPPSHAEPENLNNYLHEEGATQLDRVKTKPRSLFQAAGDRVSGHLLVSLGSALVVGFLLGKCSSGCSST